MRLLPALTAVLLLGALLAPEAVSPASALALVLGALLLASFTSARGAALLLLLAALALGSTFAPTDARPPSRAEEPAPRALEALVLRGCDALPEGGARCLLREGDALLSLRVLAPCDAQEGDTLRALAAPRPLLPERNDGLLGAGASLFRQGVTHTATAPSCAFEGGQRGPLAHLRRAARRLRRALDAGLSRALPPAPRAQARALLFGDTSSLSEATAEEFRRSGLAHLLAVSGAHIALLGALGAWLARRFLLRSRRLLERGLVAPLAALLPLPATLLLVFVTGESPSAWRAWVASLFASLATARGRSPSPPHVLALSLLVTLAARPGWLWDPGWQLSMSATAAMLAGARSEEEPLALSPRARPSALAEALLGPLRASLRVALVASPVLAWHFRQLPLTAVLANALAAPVGEVLGLPLVLLTAALGLLPGPLVRPVALFSARCLEGLFAAPSLALRLPLATLEVPPPSLLQAIALTLGSLLLLRARTLRAALAGAAGLLLLVLSLEALHRRAVRPPADTLRITAVDVGQGDALLLELPDGEAALLDGGGALRAGAPDPGERVLWPWLAQQRRTRLAAVLASHPHPDHVGGLAAVLRRARVGELWDNRVGEGFTGEGGSYARLRAAAAERGVPVRGPEALCGAPRDFHGVQLRVLSPCPDASGAASVNDGSLVLRLDFGAASALLPGDLEAPGERALLEALEPVTLLKLGHHGSRTSSTEDFLARLRPRLALFSAGHPSPFGHPHPEVLERLARRGVEVHGTPARGRVSVTLWRDGRAAVSYGPPRLAPW